jgi:SSS family solute:Na+ symporter
VPETGRIVEVLSLAGYLIALLWIGFRSARQVRTSEDYTLAGRDLPWIVVLATTAATMIGGGASVGIVGNVWKVGIAAALITIAWHLQLIFTGLWVAPQLRGMNLITVGDFIGLKFGPLARALAVVNCLIFLVGAMTAQLVAMGSVTEQFLGLPYRWALLVAAGVTIFYSTAGGMRAVVKTDVLQFVILVFGMSVASVVLLYRHGGFGGLVEKLDAAHFHVAGAWSWWNIAGLFLTFLLGETFVPPYVVRCFAAKDAQQARWGVAGAGIFLVVFLPIVTFALGSAAKAEFADEAAVRAADAAKGDPTAADAARAEQERKVLPLLLRRTLPPWLAGVMIAALVAATMSSADSVLSCGATIVMEDLYARYADPHATDRRMLRVAQAATLVMGVAAAAAAYFFSRNVVEVLKFVYDYWAPTMIVPFVVGIFWYRPTRIYAVVASMVGGFVVTTIWRFGLGSPYDLGAVVGLAAALAVFVAALPLTARIRLRAAFEPERTLHGGEER